MNGRYRSRQSLGAFRRRAGGVLRTPSRRTAYTAGVRARGGRGGMTRFKTKFAMSGYARDTEKKYSDRASVALTGPGRKTGESATVDILNGFMFQSNTWRPYDFAGPVGSPSSNISNNMLRYIGTGSTATTRIGNKITVKYIKGSITVTASKLVGPSIGATNGDMGGEALATASNATSVWQYLRTTFRVVIVKDLQVNSADAQIAWADVFEDNTASGPLDAVGDASGVHAELKIANMGRFRILSDKIIKTNAINPQETIPYLVPGSAVGNVRYNGNDYLALTDQGIYVIWAAFTLGATAEESATDGMVKPAVVMNSRVCFTDS